MSLEYPKFELISEFTNENLIPKRATEGSAGYDFIVARDTVVPSYFKGAQNISEYGLIKDRYLFELDEVKEVTKKFNFKPTLVPTGIKAYIPKDQYLQLSVRSSCPLKHWLILANGVGIIDSDYYNNPDNEGHIYFQIINLFPQDILLREGDKIGQGVFLNYKTIKEDTTFEWTNVKRTGGFGSTSNNFNVNTSKFC